MINTHMGLWDFMQWMCVQDKTSNDIEKVNAIEKVQVCAFCPQRLQVPMNVHLTARPVCQKCSTRLVEKRSIKIATSTSKTNPAEAPHMVQVQRISARQNPKPNLAFKHEQKSNLAASKSYTSPPALKSSIPERPRSESTVECWLQQDWEES
jgi:hypothetical protein